ncbi:MAG: hypothetical protein DYG92_11885 [Leptolyngbya sp. PLA1]|nr:hypothetical protein [Leptolyngbya sp. PLA1]
MSDFTLRSLPASVRLGLVCLCLVVLVGLGASATHLLWHYEKRDERAGFSYDDIAGAYHGVSTVAPLRRALERGHPETLAKPQRDALLDWLLGKADSAGKRPGVNPRVSDEYDNPDLGDMAPAEIMSRSCAECHARANAAKSPIARTYPLDTWDDIRSISISRDVKPTDPKKLVISIHAHALSLGCLSLVLSFMLWWTRWPRGVVGGAIFLASLGLLVDFACQILARQSAPLVAGIIVGGTVYSGMSVLTVLAVIADLLLPRPRGA